MRFVYPLLTTLLLISNICGQTVRTETKHFEKNGLEFDYPTAWKITEGSPEESEYVEMGTENKTAQMIIHWNFGAVLDCEFEGTRKRMAQGMADRIATQIHTTSPPETSWQEVRLGKLSADEIQIQGQVNNTAVIAAVYSLLIKHEFLTLVYLRVASEESANSAWDTVRTTLKVNHKAGKNPNDGGILNGKAIRLPTPPTPETVRPEHARSVVVQVLINESGYVIAACTISGEGELRRDAEAAAMQAKFTPTKLNGRPIRVTGKIIYHFGLYRSP